MVDAASPAEGADNDHDEVDEKLELALFSYSEVLDATKHQDDKIGRMITSIAFLTAAALSLAALGGAKFVTRLFYVSPYYIPLGLITLVTFLVGVIFAVLLLLGSLATPLRIPGLGEEIAPERKRRRPQKWVGGVETSQIYFYQIAGVSLDKWVSKWDPSTEDLKEERLDSVIREIHNLAVRTRFKYIRGTEAVSILSFSLLTLGLAASFVAIAAATPGDNPIDLDAFHRVILGLLLGGYGAMQLLIRVKYDSQEITEAPQQWTFVRNPRTFANMFGLFVLAIVVFEKPMTGAWLWILLIALLGLLSLASYVLAAPKITKSSDVGAQLRSNQLTIPIAMFLATASVTVSASLDWYAAQLLTAILLVFSLNAVQIIATDRRTRTSTAQQSFSEPTGSSHA